jgi:hypothetical protein
VGQLLMVMVMMVVPGVIVTGTGKMGCIALKAVAAVAMVACAGGLLVVVVMVMGWAVQVVHSVG